MYQFFNYSYYNIRKNFQKILTFDSMKIYNDQTLSESSMNDNFEKWPRLFREAIFNLQDHNYHQNEFASIFLSNKSFYQDLIFQKCPELKIIQNLLEKLSLNDTIIYNYEKSLKLEIYGNSIHIHGFPSIKNFSILCLIFLTHSSSLLSNVISISLGEDFSFSNADGTSSIQSKKNGFKPYHDLGLTGKNQICGIADSGVNDLSCFFVDDSNEYETHSIIRSWGIEHSRRKIIQYIPYADSVDDEGGHGTHTCGTLAGNSNSIFIEENGIAPDAKIAFFDIGRLLLSFIIFIYFFILFFYILK